MLANLRLNVVLGPQEPASRKVGFGFLKIIEHDFARPILPKREQEKVVKHFPTLNYLSFLYFVVKKRMNSLSIAFGFCIVTERQKFEISFCGQQQPMTSFHSVVNSKHWLH
jgi:hypothetical protein